VFEKSASNTASIAATSRASPVGEMKSRVDA